MSSVNIAGLPKAQVFKALFDASKQQGMGFFDERGALPITIEQAEKIVSEQMHYDYVYGRVMKVSIDSDELNPGLFDRDNGEGAAARAIKHLRVKLGESAIKDSLTAGGAR